MPVILGDGWYREFHNSTKHKTGRMIVNDKH